MTAIGLFYDTMKTRVLGNHDINFGSFKAICGWNGDELPLIPNGPSFTIAFLILKDMILRGHKQEMTRINAA